MVPGDAGTWSSKASIYSDPKAFNAKALAEGGDSVLEEGCAQEATCPMDSLLADGRSNDPSGQLPKLGRSLREVVKLQSALDCLVSSYQIP